MPQEPDVVCAVRDRLQSLVTALASEWGGALPLVQVRKADLACLHSCP